MNQHSFNWKFYRIGGLDQVSLRTTEELRHLDELDAKLWVVLSLPVKSLQFDQRTLAFVDADQDDRIRMPEIREAVRWAVDRLQDPTELTAGADVLPLSSIQQDTEAGQQMLASARRVLTFLGKPDATGITVDDATQAVDSAAKHLFNGDGILPPSDNAAKILTTEASDKFDDEMNAFLHDVLAAYGGVPDASGQMGVSQELADKFLADARACLAWRQLRDNSQTEWPLGNATEAAYAVLQGLAPKIDDYFLRCELVDYDARAADKVNAPESVLELLGSATLGTGSDGSALLDALPLARASADCKVLPLRDGVNPAWTIRMREFDSMVVQPILGDRATLSPDDWATLKNTFATFAAIMSQRPHTAEAIIVRELDTERLRTWTDMSANSVATRFAALVEQDLAAAPEVARMCDVEKLTRYYQHLHQLLMNFVSFVDFYTQQRATPFEIGSLFIDGRACKLCVRVDTIDDHASHSAQSFLCLAYCTCTRRNAVGEVLTLQVAAAVTAGTDERLTPGRHGVFVDREGNIWDATLVKLVANPISIRTAMFAPYRRLARMVTDQIEKFTASKDAGMSAASGKAVEKMFTAPAAAPAGSATAPASTAAVKPVAAPAPPFDIGKSMGIFAAIGLALGALGTALATIAASLMTLQWWQFPLLFIGIFLLISGPSMLLAWLKLRKRTLGPVLNASGWAVNSRIPVNFMLGHVLTDSAALPPNTERSLNDPFQKPGFWKGWMTALLVVIFLAGSSLGGWWGWNLYQERNSVSDPAVTGAGPATDPANKTKAELDALAASLTKQETTVNVNVEPITPATPAQ